MTPLKRTARPLQGGGVRLADHCLGEATLTLINHEVSPSPLLAITSQEFNSSPIIDFIGCRQSATTEPARVCYAADDVASVCITCSYSSSIVQISGSGPGGSGVNMLQAHDVGDEARTEEERISFSFCLTRRHGHTDRFAWWIPEWFCCLWAVGC